MAQRRPGHPYCPSCRSIFKRRLPRCPADGFELTMLEDDPLPGTTIRGLYRVETLIGSGSTGRVYRARRAAGGTTVALKVLFGEHAADRSRAARFRLEADSAASLRHPNIVRLLDRGDTETGVPFLVMEHLHGPSLLELVEREGPLPATRARRLLSDLCRALAYLHCRGLIHRDLKGDNVIVVGEGDDEAAVLLDFGIALPRRAQGKRRVTSQRTAVGTMGTMAPEQGLSSVVDQRADLFSLGVLLYQMLAGRPPFDGPPTLIALQNALAPVPAVSERTPGIRPDPLLEAVALKLMAKDPGDRFAGAGDVLEALGGGFA